MRRRSRSLEELTLVKVSYSGNETFTDEQLESVILDERGTDGQRRMTRPVADDAAWVIEEYYFRQGFSQAVVTYEFDPGNPPEVDGSVHFDIVEGPRTQLTELLFDGRDQVSGSELRSCVRINAAGFYEGKPTWYSLELANELAADVGGYYFKQGFLEARVGDPVVELSEDLSTAKITLPISEGLLFRLEEVSVSGSIIRSQSDLLAITAPALGEPYKTRVAYELRAKLLGELQAAGRREATAEFVEERDQESGAVRLEFKLDDGPEIRIGAVRVAPGRTQVREGFILSKIQFEAGDLWSASAEEQSFRSLFRSGIFRSIELDFVPPGEALDPPPPEEFDELPEAEVSPPAGEVPPPGQGGGADAPQDVPPREEQDEGLRPTPVGDSDIVVLDLVVELEDLPTSEVYIEPGWGSYELARVSAGAIERNLFGTGRNVSAEGVVAVRAQRAVLSLINPWFLGSNFTMTYSLFAGRRKEPAFTRNSFGAAASLGRRWNQIWSSSLTYRYRLGSIDDIKADPGDSDLDKAYDVSSFMVAATRNTRVGLFLPTDGSLVNMGLEWAGSAIGSQLDFWRATFAASRYKSLSDELVVGVAARGGVIGGLGSTGDIPLQERFFNGGEDTVRSYYEDELGPLDSSGDPLGGEGFTAFTVELRRHLFDKFAGAVFVDAGNVTEKYEDFLEFEQLRYAIGTGVRYLLPVGPLRLDAAWNPDPGHSDDDWAVHFAVGLAF